MNFFIPDIGTMLVIDQDWTLTLFNEHRNISMLNHLFKMGKVDNPKANQIITLPKGLVVKVDRIYIRKGLPQYSSITFSIPKPKTKSDREEMPLNMDYYGNKFWAKLHECNGINVSPHHGNKETHDLMISLYKEIERDLVGKFGIEKCTKMMSYINRLLGPGQNISNLKTYLTYDQLLSLMSSRMKEEDLMFGYLQAKIKTEIREFKIKRILP